MLHAITSRKLRSWLLTGFGMLMVGYFVAHTLSGERGVFALVQLQQNVKDAQNFLSDLNTANNRQQNRIRAMRPGQMDADLVDEESRRQLNAARPDELVIILPRKTD